MSHSAFVEHGQVFERVGQRGVVWGQGLLADVQRPLVHVLGRLVLPPLRVQRRQVVEGLGAVGVIGAQDALAHLQGAAQEHLGGAGKDAGFRRGGGQREGVPGAACVSYSRLFWR